MLISPPVLIFLYAFSTIMTVSTAYYSFKVWRMGASGNFTWSMIFGVNLIQMMQLGISLPYIGAIPDFLIVYPIPIVIAGIALRTVSTTMLFIFVYNVYKTLTRVLPPIHHG